jgi:hypothetical protein
MTLTILPQWDLLWLLSYSCVFEEVTYAQRLFTNTVAPGKRIPPAVKHPFVQTCPPSIRLVHGAEPDCAWLYVVWNSSYRSVGHSIPLMCRCWTGVWTIHYSPSFLTRTCVYCKTHGLIYFWVNLSAFDVWGMWLVSLRGGCHQGIRHFANTPPRSRKQRGSTEVPPPEKWRQPVNYPTLLALTRSLRVGFLVPRRALLPMLGCSNSGKLLRKRLN